MIKSLRLKPVTRCHQNRNEPLKLGGFFIPKSQPSTGFLGTLFGVISAPNTMLNYKARNDHCIQPFTLDLSALPSDSVMGTESRNILIDTEMMMDAVAFLHSQVIQIKQGHRYMNMSKRLRILEANHG
ncbi:hypothetical protein [Vibrio rhizosphaerae]|uniref:hypothetical protein n=1 Tax=Vibrio rhizosphaerae TaxID=398736 RepID=UPI0021C33F58|nr:hypothetical protein [Vibrio rhizosphaerae]